MHYRKIADAVAALVACSSCKEIEQLTKLVGLPGVHVEAKDSWMPQGLPVLKAYGEWARIPSKKQNSESRLRLRELRKESKASDNGESDD